MEKHEGVLDRIEDGKAVILVESIGKEFLIDESRLPEGSVEGMWFNLTIVADDIKEISIDHQITESREQQVNEKLNRLRKKKTGSKFRRN